MKRIIILIPMVFVLLFLPACSKKAVPDKHVKRVPGEAMQLSGEEYTAVGESEHMLLQINPSTGCIRWEDKGTGEYMETKIFDTGQNDVSLKSDVLAYYYSGSKTDLYKAYSCMDSYTYAVETGTMTYEKMDNGIRICYSIGSDKVTYKDFPVYINEDRMNELVLKYLDKSGQSFVLKQYRLTQKGIYARKTNKDNPLAGLAATKLYKLFYETAHYNAQELETDNTEFDQLAEMPTRQKIEMTMEYYLDGDDLVVRIPTKEMSWNSEFPLKSLDVLPYFMSTKETKDGYLFVPDGSGALIYLDNDKLKEYQFTSRYYGGDVLVNAESQKTSDAYMTLPVYGMKVGSHAVLGIIEKGAEIATLNAYVNGSYNNIPYSRLSLNFMINEEQTLASYTGAITNYTLKKVSDDYYCDDIKIRYCYLTGENADYSGMAHAYQQYLAKNGELVKNEPEKDAAFFVELLGEIDKQCYMLGIPYQGKQKLTTFGQAEEILSDMNKKGISNIKVEYTGMVNDGISQRSVKKVRIADQLGGKKGFDKLLKTAQSTGAQVYPNILLQTAYTSKGLPKKERAFFISGQAAQLYDFDYVEKEAILDTTFPRYIIRPAYITKYIDKFIKSYSKFDNQYLASEDFLTFISADYRHGGNLSMTNSAHYYLEALVALAQKNRLMLSNPIQPAYKEASVITDLPMGNSRQKTYNAEIPFTQMVMDGYLTYSSEYLNESSYDVWDSVMKAIETKSALKFRFLASDIQVLKDTYANDVFSAEYNSWSEKIGGYYKTYNDFYQKVKNAGILRHEIIGRNNDHIAVTYSNNIKVYINYGDEAADINGVTVEADNFAVREGGEE